MSNIALINRYARDRGVERTKMWTVVQKGNLQLAALVDHAAALGFSKSGVFARAHRFRSLPLAGDQRRGERRTES
jgi:hypothetical protein